MHFRIWIQSDRPSATTSPDPLINVGLGHLAHGFHTAPLDIENKRGVVYHWPRPGDMSPADSGLKWEDAIPFRGLDGGRYRVGYNPEKLPRATELQVPLPITGEHIPLNDPLQTWIVPDVLFLPANLVLTADGVKMERLSRFQGRTFDAVSWIERCQEFTKQIREGRAEEGVDWEKGWHFGYDSLALNYRLTPEIVNLLGLLNTETIRAIVLSAIGAVEIHRRQKYEPEPVLIDESGDADG